MKDLFAKLASLFRKTWVWSLCLVLLTALLVWFVGPLLAVNDFKFWESSSSRLVSISLLFFICSSCYRVFGLIKHPHLRIH